MLLPTNSNVTFTCSVQLIDWPKFILPISNFIVSAPSLLPIEVAISWQTFEVFQTLVPPSSSAQHFALRGGTEPVWVPPLRAG